MFSLEDLIVRGYSITIFMGLKYLSHGKMFPHAYI